MISSRLKNEYCIEAEINNQFRNWINFDPLLKQAIIGADLAHYASNVKKIKESDDYLDTTDTLINKFESIISTNRDKKPEDLLYLYLEFLDQNIKKTIIKRNTKKDPDKERRKADAEDEAIAKERKVQREIECESNFEFNSLKENLFRLLPNVKLSTCERQAFEEVTNLISNEERHTLSNFSPKGIVHLANRASYKMYVERLMNSQDYKIDTFMNSDQSCYPDIDHQNHIY